MKTKYWIIGTIMLGLFSVTTSCDTNFEKLNIDPEHVTGASMNYNYLLTSAELITCGNSDGNAYETWRNNLIYASCMIQHLSSTTGYWAGDKYTFNAAYNTAYWDTQYPNSIRNIVETVENSKDNPDKVDLYNIARIFKVYMFQVMTDMYGDIPYSQAGLGYIDGITSPKYDAQADIYEDMLNELADAASNLKNYTGINTVGSSDLIYGGDVQKWTKFAYSEMLRLAMRLTKRDDAKAGEWAKKAYEGGVMETIDDNAIVAHETGTQSDSKSNPNGWVLDGVDPSNAKISETFMAFLKNHNDPRIPWIATVVSDPSNTADRGDNTPSIQLGQPNGYGPEGGTNPIDGAPNWPGNQNDYSIVNRTTFSRTDAPTFFVTAAETQLLLAEARKRGYISAGNTEDYYKRGVQAAILQLNQTGAALTQTDVDNYLSANPYDDSKGLEMINNQYWVATFMDEYEAWANWRRSGFPNLTPVNYPGNATNGTIPRRFVYPVGEDAQNSENYNEAVSNLSDGNTMTSRVWWDKQ